MEGKKLRDILTELVRIIGYNYNKPHTAEDEYKWINQAISAIKQEMLKVVLRLEKPVPPTSILSMGQEYQRGFEAGYNSIIAEICEEMRL